MKRLFFILCISFFAHADIFKYTSGGITSLAILDTNQRITAFDIGSNGDIWYGTREGFVFRTVNGVTDSLSFRNFGNGKPVMAIESAPNGDIWVGAEILFRYRAGNWSSYSPPKSVMWGIKDSWSYKSYVHYWINDIAIESDSVLWLASEGQGALRFTTTDEKFVMYGTYDLSNTYNSMSLVACEPGKNTVFGGRFTFGYGLYRPYSVGYLEKIVAFDSLDFRVDDILGYYHDNSDRYWVVTTRGLYVASGELKKSKFIPKNNIAATVMMAIIEDVIKRGEATDITTASIQSGTSISCKLDSKSITIEMDGRADVSICDFRGRVCTQLRDLDAGTTSLSNELASGCYLIRITQQGKTVSTVSQIN